MKILLPLTAAAILLPVPAYSVKPNPAEFEACRKWFERSITSPQPQAPVFSFKYGGRQAGSLIGAWERKTSKRTDRVWTVSYTDQGTGLTVEIEASLFADFPAAEWVVHLANNGARDTPLLEAIQAADADLDLAAAQTGLTLDWSRGAVATFDDFAPQQMVLRAGQKHSLESGEGRSSSQVLPFFNLRGAGKGVVAAIGWSGSWAAEFAVDKAGATRLKAGMAWTSLILHPGERIRTPRMLLLFYEGDRWRGQNLLRQFILAHHRPKLRGQPLIAPVTCGNWGGTSAAVHLDNIRKIIQYDLPVDYYWIDAEWYGKPGPAGSWAQNVGSWEVRKDLYPDGFQPLSTELRRTGRELMLWFEPERVVRGTPWHMQRREWLLDRGGSSMLFNLGLPTARQFVTDFLSERIREFGLGCYRQDSNINPLPFWRANDAPDRQGISEIRHIEGLYAFWDALLARFPNLLIDNCASGGRRIDLETVGRSTPFWRTDGPRDPIAHQCHTYGLLAWVPLHATSQDRAPDDYEFRSSMSSALCLNWWVSGDKPSETIPADFPFAWAKKALSQYLDIRKYYYGDFYPLTTYSQDSSVWMAYQLDLPDTGEGLVVALRRPQSPYEIGRFPLHGIEGGANYEVRNLDGGKATRLSGTELTGAGLPVIVKQKPGSALFVYKRR